MDESTETTLTQQLLRVDKVVSFEKLLNCWYVFLSKVDNNYLNVKKNHDRRYS